MPGRLSDAITGISRHIHFILQPTSPSVDDLHPSILVFQALQRVQIPREHMAFALCRALGDKEAEATRDYLEAQGHAVLRGTILERLAYRNALNLGRALSETRQPSLNTPARVMMLDLLDRALTVATSSNQPERPRRKRA
jgi:chromosome partitioning protein